MNPNNDWWVPQDEDDTWQQQQLDLFSKPVSDAQKEELKKAILDVMNAARSSLDPYI